MHSVYVLFKFLHVAAASIWIGSMVALSVLNLQLHREQDRAAMAATARHSQRVGAVLIGPSAILTLICGGVAMAVGHIGFALWNVWGMVVIVLSIVLGAVFARKTAAAIASEVQQSDYSIERIAGLQRRLGVLEAIMIVMVLSTFWVMMFKPGL